jgi:hypothetical protein
VRRRGGGQPWSIGNSQETANLAGGLKDGIPPRVARHEVIDYGDRLVHEWRVAQLTRLGVPWSLAEVAADDVDWHQIARLVHRGCPARLALHIVR